MDRQPEKPAPATGVAADTGRAIIALAAVLAVAVALRQVVVANTDVSWLLTVGEKVLAGQRLYRDVIETNPPIAMLAYLPAILLGRLVHLRPETVTDVLTFFAIGVSVSAVLLIARRARIAPAQPWPFVIFCVAVLTILPMQTFSQREHLATIALLPALAALVARSRGAELPWSAIVVAGASAAITLAFKPYFALGVVLGILTAAILGRSWRIVFAPEHWLAAVLVIGYGSFTAMVFPDYFSHLYPMVRDVYIPMKRPLGEMVGSLGVAVWIAALVLALLLRPANNARVMVLVLGAESIGFAAAYALQQKGWAYQSFPMIALALFALAVAIDSATVAASRRAVMASLAATALFFVGGMQWFNDTSDARELVAPIAKLGPHPKLLMLSSEASIGHPLVRTLDGEWVSGQQDLWLHAFITRLRRAGAVDAAMSARFDGYEAAERTMLIADIKQDPPTVVLVDNLLGDWGAWLAADPELSTLLKPYHRVATVQKIDILARE